MSITIIDRESACQTFEQISSKTIKSTRISIHFMTRLMRINKPNCVITMTVRNRRFIVIFIVYFSSGLFHKFIDLNRHWAHQHYTDVHWHIHWGQMKTFSLTLHKTELWNWLYFNINTNIKMRQLGIFLSGIIISLFFYMNFNNKNIWILEQNIRYTTF